jgi:hypothetical protein
LELNRKLITTILVAAIIIVPVVALSWSAWGPSKVEEIRIDSVLADTDRRSVLIVGSAPGSGAAFEESADLVIFHDDEQVFSGKVGFRDGILQHKLPLEDFSVGNGDYDFRLIWNEFSDRYKFQLDMVVQELGVISSASHNVQDPPPGTQPWHSLYSYTVLFKTGWNFFTRPIDANSFYTFELGSKFDYESSPLKVETGPDHGVKVEVHFEDQQGHSSRLETFDVSAGDTLERTINHEQNGSYLYKIINEKTVDIEVKVYENILVEKLPDNQEVEFLFELGTQTQTETQLVADISSVSGHIRPNLGPGEYDITIAYENILVKSGTQHSTVTFSESMILNNLPRADTSAGEPYRLSPLQRTVTFDATSSFDDGPLGDLTVFWSFGANDEGEIGSVEGTWEEVSVYTFVYPLGENPDLVNGRPYLILEDAYGAESVKANVNMQVS